MTDQRVVDVELLREAARVIEFHADFGSIAAILRAIIASPNVEQRGWLITGSRTYQDTVVMSPEWADIRIRERGPKDGSFKVPLYRKLPQPTKEKVDG